MQDDGKTLNIIDINQIAKEAGNIIMQYYSNKYEIHIKDDESPVTEADLAANDFIVASLKYLDSSIKIISEENHPPENYLNDSSGRFWLIDPIDGTKGFISKDDQFTVNIALIENHKPVLGVIYVPTKGDLYFSDFTSTAYKTDSEGTTKILKVRQLSNSGIDALISKSNDEGINQLNKLYKVNSATKIGSSLKLCYIAEGLADAYPRKGLTMEWDTAAGHAILLAAGGKIVDYENNDLIYGKADFKNPAFIALGRE